MAGYIGSKASVVSSGAERKKTFAITTNTTSLTGLSYTVGQVHVFHNGVRLVDGTDYTATNGTSITLTSAAENGDEVVVISYAAFQTSDTVSASAGGTFAGDVNFSGNVSVDGGTIKLDGNYPVGSGNVALGDAALDSISAGARNIAIGNNALTANNSNDNTALGYNALLASTSDANVAVGTYALTANTTGTSNVSVGRSSLLSDTSGSYNVGVGRDALRSNTTASNNTAVGHQAGYSDTTGDQNTFVGYVSGYSNTTGYLNCFVGYGAGYSITTGSKNTILGRYNGNQGGLDIRTSNNNIVLSDGDGNPKFFHRGSTNRAKMGININNDSMGNNPVLGLERNFTDHSSVLETKADTTNARFHIAFTNANGTVGNIQTSNSTTSYQTTSDYRLKENVVDLTNATARLAQLQPRRFNFIADGADSTIDGFLAHEVATVVPEAVSGQKDATKVDNDGNTVPEYQSMDASKLVPLLVATIKELEARITALEAN